MEKKLNTILLILAVTIAFIACSQDEQAKSTAIKKANSKYTFEYVRGISLTQPKRALKMIETGKKDGSMTNIEANYRLSSYLVWVGVKFSNAKEEELLINDASQIGSKKFDFSIE